jgi:hypothetical protein
MMRCRAGKSDSPGKASTNGGRIKRHRGKDAEKIGKKCEDRGLWQQARIRLACKRKPDD